jgi:hypothetical protein
MSATLDAHLWPLSSIMPRFDTIEQTIPVVTEIGPKRREDVNCGSAHES